ncbi:MAG TPA: response regulator [Candidatus Thermoplasmatota archaeon]|nr:response regulator [Candidatus Thermoplasmatota archaeon]
MGTPPTVLVVDDEPDILATLASFLELAVPEARVFTASSGESGLAVLEREHVDVVVSDFKMPGMDGLEFLRRCSHLRPSVASILLTAFPDRDVAIRALNEARILHFLTKPPEPVVLGHVVQAALAAQQEVSGNVHEGFRARLEAAAAMPADRAHAGRAGP